MIEPKSERFIAGSVALDPGMMARLSSVGISHKDFEDPLARRVVKTAGQMLDDELAGAQVLVDILKEKKKFPDQTEWSELLSQSWDEGEDAWKYHLENVATSSKCRQAYSLMTDASRDMQKLSVRDREKIIGEVVEQLVSLSDHGLTEVFSAKDIAEEMLLGLEKQDAKPSRVSTGFWELDNILGGGLIVSRVIVNAGHTNHGKSLFTDQIMLQMAKRWARQGEGVMGVKFSCEDDRVANKLRLTANLTCDFGPGVPLNLISRHLENTSRLAPHNLETVQKAANLLRSLNIHIDPHSSPNRSYLLSRLTELSARGTIGLITFDYLEFTGVEGPTKNQQIDATMVVLHEMAKKFTCPVIAVSQLKEGASERKDGIPTLADLAWSSFIKKIAPQVIMVHHQHEHWNQMGQTYDQPPELDYNVMVRKNKGSLGTAEMTLVRECLRLQFPEPEESEISITW